jgi:diphthine methyl ester synthase
MLYIIGLGLGDEKSISLEGLEAVKNCDKIYLEFYTSRLQCDVSDLEKLFDKKIIRVNRNVVEEELDLGEAKDSNIALLVIGDVFSATTHISVYNDCKENEIDVKIINNASVFTVVGLTGLSLYNFGKVGSIPFENKNVESAVNLLRDNKKINAHTLFLLDLDPDNGKYLSIKEAINYLEERNFDDKVIGCARLGSDDFLIKYGSFEEVRDFDFGEGPYCLIVPSEKLHFVESENLEKWK